MMKAAQVNELATEVQIVQVEIPEPKDGEILIEIQYCGCCHTDIHAINGDWPVKPKIPFVPGHEGVGIVKKLGPNVHNYQEGDRVGVPWLHGACGYCEFCISGWETLCMHQSNSGYNVDGCFRKFTVAPATHAIPLPADYPLEEIAPILCAGVTSYKALKESEARPGQFVCILGAAGGLGHLAIQYSKAMGHRVIAMDLGYEKEEYCKSLGAEYYVAVDQDEEFVFNLVQEYTKGGCHAVIVIATHISAYSLAVKLSRKKGTIVCVSLPKGVIANLNIVEIVTNRLTIRGSIVGTREDMREAIDFAVRGLVKCKIEVRPLERVNETIADLVANKIRGRVVFSL